MFFTNLYEKITENEKEEILKTLFLHTDSEFCAKARNEYYSTRLRHMGKNVTIGTGVKFVNPEYISIGDNVKIMDDVTIIARGEGGVEIGFKADDAKDIVLQTIKGAVELLQANGNHPEAEIDKVTTPGGVTIRGLNEMEHAGFTSAVIRGLKAGMKK